MYIQAFPIYGIMFGVNYWQKSFSEDFEDSDEEEYMIQIMIGLFGLSIHWWQEQ
jgi:hypothetical protein